MSSRARILNRYLKRFDEGLFAYDNSSKGIDIMRMNKTLIGFNHDGAVLRVLVNAPQIVLPLSHNWSIHGKYVEWGIEPILTRLQEIDAWTRHDIFEKLESNDLKNKEAKKRSYSNEAESFAKDFRSAFKKDYAYVNTALMEKTDRRREDDGSCKS